MSPRNLILLSLLAFLAVELKRESFALAPLFVTFAMTVGIGHGIFDVYLAKQKFKLSLWFVSFLYILVMVVAGLLAHLFPVPLLVIHGSASAYHFGQTEWGHRSPTQKSNSIWFFLWGLGIIGVMIFGPWEQSRFVIQALAPEHGSALVTSLDALRSTALRLSGVLGITSIFALESKIRPASERALGLRLLELAMLWFLFLSTPLWIGFSLYLSIWHGLNSLLSEVLPRIPSDSERWRRAGRMLVIFALLGATIFYSVVAIISRAPTGNFSLLWFASPSLFTLIIAVTFPHSFVMAMAARQRDESQTSNRQRFIFRSVV